ncbi:hypothetical protein ACHAW5_010914 [Stephanodiscus triporus]|uniref:Uncharacterized protein n=1 Tax=Stephanodiscus triporus TaxID=2934178 RepID=A0ABD3NAD2_9STRA
MVYSPFDDITRIILSLESSSVGLFVPTPTAGKFAANDETTSASGSVKPAKDLTMTSLQNSACDNIAAAGAHDEGKDDTTAARVGDDKRTEEEIRDGAEEPFVEKSVASDTTVNWSVNKSGGQCGIIGCKNSTKSNTKSNKSNASKKKSTKSISSMNSKGSTKYNGKADDSVGLDRLAKKSQSRAGIPHSRAFETLGEFDCADEILWVDQARRGGCYENQGVVLQVQQEGCGICGAGGSVVEGKSERRLEYPIRRAIETESLGEFD